MNLLIPQNIYAAIFALYLPDEIKTNIEIKSASVLTKEFTEGDYDLAIIPSCDLLNVKDIYVSGKTGISFDGVLSNSYLYFSEDENEQFDKILLRGDVSSNEIILAKILFKERFNKDIELILDTNEIDVTSNNYLIAGNDNLEGSKLFNKGVSFSDFFSDVLNFPYVNFVLISKSEEKLKEVNKYFKDADSKISEKFDKLLQNLEYSDEKKDFLLSNLEGFYIEFTENEEVGLTEILRMPFYHGIIKEIKELNLVK